MKQPSVNTTLPPANHVIWKQTGRTSIAAFESARFPDPKTPPKINRFYREKFCYSPMDDGRAVGHATGPTCALLIKVTPNSLVAIAEKLRGNASLAWRYYQVGTNLEIVPLDFNNRRLTREEINTILADWPAHEPEIFSFDDGELKVLFTSDLPPWLDRIADAQLANWRVQQPERYFQYSRNSLDAAGLQACVELAPYWALARWRDRLSTRQVDDCICKCPVGAVMFATDRIPPEKRHEYISKHPEAALAHAADRLTDEELGMCAYDKTRAALLCRGGLPPRRRAIVLATVYSEIPAVGLDGSLDDFRNEVLDSIRQSPAEWLAAHLDGFTSIMDGIASSLQIRFDAAGLRRLFNEIEPSGKEAFAEYLASQI